MLIYVVPASSTLRKAEGREGKRRLPAHGKLMLTVVGELAEFERSLIMARTQRAFSAQGSAARRSDGPPS
ncbi:MAG TPA: hypothetical protein VH684_20220 [Xanthobacteraceae bacterium]|jgi:DNA invertase Pin-like site-specific DNA recombinase